MPWAILGALVVAYLLQLRMQSGKEIAEEVVKLGHPLGAVWFQKRFSIGTLNVWTDVTGHVMLMEQEGRAAAVVSATSKGVILNVFRNTAPALGVTISDTNSPLQLYVTNGVSSIVFDQDWSGIPERRLVLQDGSIVNSVVEEFSGGQWWPAKPAADKE
jgi:hypothetical protein